MKRSKLKMKIFDFLSTLFRNKDFISQENSVLAENMILKHNIFKRIHTIIDPMGKNTHFNFFDETAQKLY